MPHIHHNRAIAENDNCPSCGEKFQGKFCSFCGEKVFHPSDLAMKKFASQTVDIFTHFDSKFIRSVKYLMFYPGFLPKAYVTGNRVKYAKPMQVFVLANILFYFITHILGVSDYSPGFGDHQYFPLSSHWIFGWLKGLDVWVINSIDKLGEWKQQRLHLSNTEFAENFSVNCWIYSKTFVIILIPMYAVSLWVLLGKRFKYFGEAVIFSVYFVSFQLIVFSTMSIFVWGLHINILKPLNWLLFKTAISPVSNFFLEDFELSNLIFWVPYLFIAFQRYFKGRWNSWLINFIAAFVISKVFYYLTFGVYKKLLIVATVLLMHHSNH